MNILCTICARGGSKGVPKKNIRKLDGKPLIAHSIEDANSWNRDCDIVVSTDSDEIAEVAQKFGARVPFKRPDKMATDEAAKLPAIKHAVRKMEDREKKKYDYVVDLGVAAPLRKPEDIEKSFQKLLERDATNIYSVKEAEKNPYFNMVELDEKGYAKLSKKPKKTVSRRQDTPKVFEMNASIYIYEKEFLLQTETTQGEKTIIYEMPPERSVDIDRPIDLKIAELIAQETQ